MAMRVLIFFVFVPLILAQMQSTTNMDSTIQQVHNSLKDKESSLAASVKDLSTKFAATTSSLSSIPKLKSLTESAVNLLNLLATVNNFAAYENMATCTDINQKITTLDMDIPKYSYVQVAAATNATYLQSACSQCNLYYLINRANVPSSLNYPDLITTCNKIVQDYLASYCPNLATSRSTLAVISTNLKVYKENYCVCATTLNSAGQKVASTVTNSSAKIESILLGDQSSLISAANDAKTKITTASSLVTVAAITDRTTKISTQITKTLTLKDFPSNLTSIASMTCADIKNQTAFARGRYNAYVALYGTIGANYVTLNAQVAAYNLTYAVNSAKLNETQKAACVEVINAATKLVSFYLRYYQDLGAAVSRSAVILADVQRAGNSYCACTSSTTTTTTTTTAATTTSSTVAGVTTTAAPFCLETLTIIIRGQPYKNLCRVNTPKTYQMAYDDCLARGMMLFAILNQDDKDAALGAAGFWFNNVPALTFYVNGKLSGSTWTVNDPSSKDLFSGAVPSAGTLGECLTVSNMFGGVQTAKWDCNGNLWSICEFNATSRLK